MQETNEILKKTWISYLIYAIASIALGVLLIVWPDVTVKVCMIVAGVLSIIVGVVQLSFLIHAINKLLLIRPIITIALGVIMICVPMFMAQVTAVLIGVFFILYGLLMLMVLGSTIPTEKYMGWIMGAIFIALGIAVIIFNEDAVKVIAIIFGVAMLIYGAFSLMTALKLRKLKVYVEQA